MIMGCGVAPRGSLRLAHLAAKLNPVITGGPCMLVSLLCLSHTLLLSSLCQTWCALINQAYVLTSTLRCSDRLQCACTCLCIAFFVPAIIYGQTDLLRLEKVTVPSGALCIR